MIQKKDVMVIVFVFLMIGLVSASHTLEVIADTTAPVINFSCSPTSVIVGETITCSCSATDNLDSSPTVSYTSSPSTSSTGSFTTTCTAEDDAGNSGTSSISYSVSSSSGGSLNSGSSQTWTMTYNVNEENFEKGYTRNLKVKQRFKISVENREDEKNETHYVGVVEIANSSVKIKIESEVQEAVLNVGDEKKFDVVGDGYYDIYIKLNSISGGEANLSVKKIYEEIVNKGITGEVVDESGNVEDSVGEDVKEGKFFYVWWVVGGVVLIGVVLFFVWWKFSKNNK